VRSVSDLYAPIEPQVPSKKTRRTLPIVLGGIAVAALLVIGVAAAIGGDDDAKVKDPVALLTGAPDAVRDRGSARIKATMAIQVAGRDVDMTMDGVTEFASNKGTITMSMMGQTIDMVSDGTTMYMHLPAMMRGVGSAEWVAFPVTAGAAGTFDSATGVLDALRGVGADVQEVGTEEVNGVDATHYRATVDLQRALDAAPESQRERARTALGQLGTSDVPIDVWLSSDGLPVRQVITFDAPAGGGLLGGMSMKMTIDFTDWGTPVDVQVPPADQVQRVDDPSKLGQLFGGAGTTD